MEAKSVDIICNKSKYRQFSKYENPTRYYISRKLAKVILEEGVLYPEHLKVELLKPGKLLNLAHAEEDCKTPTALQDFDTLPKTLDCDQVRFTITGWKEGSSSYSKNDYEIDGVFTVTRCTAL